MTTLTPKIGALEKEIAAVKVQLEKATAPTVQSELRRLITALTYNLTALMEEKRDLSGLSKRKFDDDRFLEAAKRMRHDESSRKGSITEARLVHTMREENQLIEDVKFDDELKKIRDIGDFWVESTNNPKSTFPPVNAGEKMVVQPFFVDILNKFTKITAGNRTVYKAGADGKYTVPTELSGKVECMVDASVEDTPTVGSRKPDVNVYYETNHIKGILRVVSSWELTPRGSKRKQAFTPSEIGQVIDTNMELLRQQPFRIFTLAVLSDGVRFMFFKIIRKSQNHNDYTVKQSSLYSNMRGWAIAFALLLQPPSFFGYKCFEMDKRKFVKVIGQGAHTYVFEVTTEDDEHEERRVLKLFERENEHKVELENLTKLGKLLRGLPEYKHVPKLDRPPMMITEAISGRMYHGIMSLPLCVPIRPQRGGKRLERSHYMQLLSTLKVVHSHRMYNGDIKPANVLLHEEDVVMCDWGSAVFATGDASLPVRSVGTVGYCDFTLVESAASNASHDLMALVRTIYANYTHEIVPSSSQEQADAFWSDNFLPGSMWSKAMRYAANENYDKLEKIFKKL